MRKTIALMGLITLAASPVITATASAQQVQGRVETQTTVKTRPAVQEIVLLPVRLVSSAVSAPVGAVGGMAKRTGDAVEWVNNKTFRNVTAKDEAIMENPGKQFGRGIFLVPAGIAGTAVALPVGVAAGAVEGTFKGLTKGFTWPDRAGL